MKKITIIVPIYNVEKYARKCFDSLLNQTFRDFIIMAVNDGSPDNSKTIIKEYMAKYPDMFTFIDKENGGYGSVLQRAIRECTTEYFLVCDPDDYLPEHALKTLYDLADSSNADLTIGAKTFVYNGTDREDYDKAYNTGYVTLPVEKVINREDKEYNDLFFIDPSPHAKLYRRSLSLNIVFPHKVGYTDNLLFYVSLLNARKVIYTDVSCAYYLIDRPGNTMTDVSEKAIDGNIFVFKEILKQTETLKAPDIFYYRMFESYKFILREMDRMKVSKEVKEKKLWSLYEFVTALQPHTGLIREYDKFSKAKIIEKIRDKACLNPALSKQAYKAVVKKTLEK